MDWLMKSNWVPAVNGVRWVVTHREREVAVLPYSEAREYIQTHMAEGEQTFEDAGIEVRPTFLRPKL